MDLTKIKAFIKTYWRPITCIRILLMYWFFLFVVTHTAVFDYGVTKGKINLILSFIVMFYRFLSIAFVPGVLVLWFFERRKI
jgi:hypothetical protein